MSRQMRNDKVIGGTSNNASAILYEPADTSRSETNVEAELDRINNNLSALPQYIEIPQNTFTYSSQRWQNLRVYDTVGSGKKVLGFLLCLTNATGWIAADWRDVKNSLYNGYLTVNTNGDNSWTFKCYAVCVDE